jgi:hypothetical protein
VGKYDDLLEEVRSRAAAYISTAKIYIPKMYEALMNESKDISPEDARDRIEKDCFGIWAKRTILDALPDEAKNRKKQESGRLGQKKRNFAAVSAAPEAGAAKIILDTNGRSIDERSTINRSNGQVKENIKECPSCHSSSQEPKAALKVYASVTTDKQIAQNNSEGCLEVELSVPFRPLLQHMINAFNSNNKTERILFPGKLNIQTRKVLMSVGSVLMSVDVPPWI